MINFIDSLIDNVAGKFITYTDLKILPFILQRILELKIERKINAHTKLTFTGIINEVEKDLYVKRTTIDTPIIVMANAKPLFAGILRNIEIKAINGVYHLAVEALSYTYKMDMFKKRRSFQYDRLDKLQPYDQVIRQIIKDYPRADVIEFVAADACPKSFLLQYDETDWEFLRRIASHFDTGLVPACEFDAPKFFFGVPLNQEIENLTEINYTYEKNTMDWLNCRLRHFPDLKMQVNDFAAYTVESANLLPIGQLVLFKGEKLYVQETSSVMNGGVVKHYHKLTRKLGLTQTVYSNPKIVGLSLEGIVLDVKQHEIQVRLFIDEAQPPESPCWFQYSTIYTAGWSVGSYLMPEINDKVRIYFPSSNENDGFALHSFFVDTLAAKPGAGSEGNYTLERDRLIDPAVKSLKTSYKKEIIFAPDRIVIHGEGMSLTLIDDVGVEIYTKNNAMLQARETISLEARTITLEGKESIHLFCRGNAIDMSQSKIAVKGPGVRIK